MNIQLSNGFHISDIIPADKPAYLEFLKEKQIYDQTLNIPYPYTESDADWWINHVAEETQKQGQSVNWAIRRDDGYLVGGIGYHGLEVGRSHRAEIGYWLAKPYWKHGVMTEAVKRAVEFAFAELGLVRITANVFHFNQGSARVLEKSGFRLEGYLRQHYKKAGNIFDGRLYAIRKDDRATSGLLGLEFVYLFVSDLQKSKHWYEKALGTPPAVDLENFVQFQLGSGALCLHPADSKSPTTTGGSVGYWRVLDFDEQVGRLASLGASVYRGPLEIGDGTVICQIKDPLGNVFGLVGRKSS